MSTTEFKSFADLLIDELPPGFAAELLQGMSLAYPEAYATVFGDTKLEEEQASYCLGYYRRAIAESTLKRVATQFNLGVEITSPDGGGCKFVRVSAGRFVFTMCHVPSRSAFPKFSDSREQSSKVNDHVAQQLALFQDDAKKIDDQKKVYGVFIHTETPYSKEQMQSIQIGFPNTDFSDWIDSPINLMDVVDLQSMLFKKPVDHHVAIQDAQPKWKKKAIDVTKSQGEE